MSPSAKPDSAGMKPIPSGIAPFSTMPSATPGTVRAFGIRKLFTSQQAATDSSPTSVAGMSVRSDDLIHADRHGAVVIPLDIAAKVPEAAELCGRRETPILDIARSKDFTLEKLKEALKRSAEIH